MGNTNLETLKEELPGQEGGHVCFLKEAGWSESLYCQVSIGAWVSEVCCGCADQFKCGSYSSETLHNLLGVLVYMDCWMSSVLPVCAYAEGFLGCVEEHWGKVHANYGQPLAQDLWKPTL